MRSFPGEDSDVPISQVVPEGPLPNRLGRATLIGCLGILCVLALPALLLLPVERWGLPPWMAGLVPLVGLGAVVLGIWLLGRVPAGGAPRRVADPLRPLTSAGRLPVVERPATAANRVALLVATGLSLACLGGYVLVSASLPHGRGVGVGTLLTAVAGLALLAYGTLAATRRMASPALRWVRAPIRGGVVYQALPAALLGFVTLVWALFVAASQGYLWAPAGVGLLIVAWALSGPLLQRLPNRPDRSTGRYGGPDGE